MIDWAKPLEAVHADGRVKAVTLAEGGIQPDYAGHYELSEFLEGSRGRFFNADGSPYWATLGWAIRNVVEQPAWRTSAEQLDRMDALVKRIRAAAGEGVRMPASDELEVVAEAKAIIAAREPIDPRFDTIHAVILRNHLVTADAARRLARDVLAALDA